MPLKVNIFSLLSIALKEVYTRSVLTPISDSRTESNFTQHALKCKLDRTYYYLLGTALANSRHFGL